MPEQPDLIPPGERMHRQPYRTRGTDLAAQTPETLVGVGEQGYTFTEAPADLSVDLEIAEQAALCGDPPLWWQTAHYIENEDAYPCVILAQEDDQPDIDDRIVAEEQVLEIARWRVAAWNETHAAPGGPLTDGAPEGEET
jgi:hypothetical protein